MKKKLLTKSFASVFYLFGFISLVYSIASTVFFQSSYFYSFFAFGSWLVLDWIDFKITKNSILHYFLNSHHRDAFLIYAIFAFVNFFLVDYLLGVSLSGVWKWANSENPQYLLAMFTLMNYSFVFSMYELYRLIKILFSKLFKDQKLTHIKRSYKLNIISILLLVLGIAMFIFAIIYFVLGYREGTILVMTLPFIGSVLVSDMLNHILGGQSLSFKLLRFNKLEIVSIAITTFIAACITENLNLFSYEWRYMEVPFSHIQFGNIPVALYSGWLGLVILSITIIHLIQRVDKVKDRQDLSMIQEINLRFKEKR